MFKTNPIQFIQEVRSEVSKVVWPTRREVMLTSIMVFILAALAALFFSSFDIVFRWGLESLLDVFG